MEVIAKVNVDSKELEAPGPITLYEAQRRFLDAVFSGLEKDIHFFVVLKARQLGITTIIYLLTIVYLFIFPGTQGAVVFDTDANKEKFRTLFKRAMDSIPKAYRVGYEHNNRQGLLLKNGSSLDYLVAGIRKGKSSRGLGVSRAINYLHASECSAWADKEGLRSLERALANKHPNRLFIFESTARGLNIFHRIWEEAKADDLAKCAVFIGWWAKEDYAYHPQHPLFERYGTAPPSTEEQRKIDEVKHRYGHVVTMEQLAWFRHQSDPTATGDEFMDDETDDGMVRQELPWTEEEAWVATGSKFFPTGCITTAEVEAAKEPYKGFRYHLGDDFFTTQLEPVHRSRDATLKVWEEPVDGAVYVVGADPAYGSSDEADRYCVTADTELLTDRGWVSMDRIRIGQRAVCFDLKSEAYSYGAVQDFIVRDHDGPMVRLASDGIDCLATPEHRVVMRSAQRASGRYKLYPWRFRPAAQVPKHVMIPFGGAPLGHGVAGLTVEMCRIIGWALTDGGMHSATGTRVFVIGQSRETSKAGLNIAGEMDRLLLGRVGVSRYDRAAKVSNGVNRSASSTWYLGVRLSAEILGWFDRHDRVPRRILTDGSREQLEALFQGLMEGDGSFDTRIDGWTKFCPGHAEALADDCQEVALRLGYSVSKVFSDVHRQWLLYLSRRPHHYVRAPQSESYTGKVWDITVPTGAFVARRNGKVFVTGNCAQILRVYADGVDQVAEFCDPMLEPFQFAWVLTHLCGAYSNARFLLELNGPGEAVWTAFRELRMILTRGYMREEAVARGLRNVFDNVRNYIWKRSDLISGSSNAFHWKCLSLDTPLATPVGWTVMNDVKIGDRLIDDSGAPCVVTFVSPVMLGNVCYRISFDDGCSIVADADHLWRVVIRSNNRQTSKTVFAKTADLCFGNFIKTVGALSLPDSNLPIDPYTLGAWLGDGSSAGGRIWAHADDAGEISGYIGDCGEIKADKGKVRYFLVNGLRHKLAECGLLNNKHIPQQYLRASAEQRLALLQGLMDTDGTVSVAAGRQCSFTTTNSALADGFAELLRSFGIKAKWIVRQRLLKYGTEDVPCAPAFQFSFTGYSNFPVFRLTRKLVALDHDKSSKDVRPGHHKIIDVTPIKSVPVRCIQVDSSSHMYAAGRSMIPTHNTTPERKYQSFVKLKDALIKKEIRVRSRECLEEMRYVVQEGGGGFSVKAEGTKKDDRPMALSLALQAWHDSERQSLIARGMTRAVELRRPHMSWEDQIGSFTGALAWDHLADKARARRYVKLGQWRGGGPSRWRW